jgi:cellulose synthase/poly-beta-1,6-N-acetylglucosamine synthase-like glycosyltransferase
VTTLGWILVAIPVVIAGYAYVAYPAILWFMARNAPRAPAPPLTEMPMVSVVIPAYNEERRIGGAIDAVLSQDYPAERIQALVISDASTDATDSIVETYAGRGVELLRMPQRSGKTKAENVACSRLHGDIVVNTDASVRLHPDAIRRLIEKMTDPAVGVASSRDVSISDLHKSTNQAEAGYVNYEMLIRDLETRTGGIIGASGSCYAIRARLHRIAIRDDLSRDFSAPLTAHLHGFTSISASEAMCYIPRTGSLRREYRRKVRTISRGMDTLVSRSELLDPTRHGLFAWKLFSHKVCRWLGPVALIPGLVGLILLAHFYLWAMVGLGAVIFLLALAAAAALVPERRHLPALLSVPAFGVAANVAVLHAIWRVVVGHHDHIWEPTRRDA